TSGRIQEAIEQAVRRQPIVIKPRFAGKSGILYAKDSARAMLLAARADKIDRPGIDLDSAGHWSFEEIAEILGRETGLPARVEGPPDLPGPPRQHIIAPGPARAIGYEPQWDIERGLRDYLAWAKTHLKL